MAKKIVAFGAGRRNGNCEVFIKEALMGAEEMGCEVEYIRLDECDLRPCKNCPGGKCYYLGPDACIYKDDGPWLADKFLESDGYILGAPVFSLSPSGIVTVFRDRVFGPKMDVAAWENQGIPEWARGKGGVKYRPGALISVGGAVTKNWTSLGMPTLYTTTFSVQTKIVDYMDVNRVADLGAATLKPERIAEAHQLGRNVAYAALHPELGNPWLKEYQGETCPGCRQNLMIYKKGNDYMECAICGTTAKIKIVDGVIDLDFERGGPDDRLTVAGLYTHQAEIATMRETEFTPFAEQAKANLQKYKDYKACEVKPPSRTKKNA